MNLPKTVKIKGKTWTVRLTKNLQDETGEEVNGLTDTEKRTIEINAELKGTNLLLIFWHEFTHAVLKESHLSGNDGGLETIVEEVICDSMADALVPYVTFKPRKVKRK